MSDLGCVSCRKAKTNFVCEICEGDVCKSCVQVLDAKSFSFLEKIPADLAHRNYCGACYDEKVTPELESYSEIMERAEKIFVFFKTQKKEIPLIKKSKEKYTVVDQFDRDETIMRLAFFAAQSKFNAIIEVDVFSSKLRNGAYQTSRWQGTGIGADIDGKRQDLQDAQNAVYR